jgi:Family of unknown function (DUF5317)
MFLLYAVVVGLLIGLLIGGRPAGLASIDFKWAPLAIAGFAIQIALFSGPVADEISETMGSVIYVASTAIVFVVVLRNVRVTGLPVVALGAASNLAAIVANGGHMPTTIGASIAAGRPPLEGFSNSAIVENAALAPLTDIFAMPKGLPLSNVFSIGDVLIAVGITVAIAVAMRRRPDGVGGQESRDEAVRSDAATGPESA